MSELQISLLGIGVAVVLAVYGYSVWQQRKYRRKFGAVFKHGHEDALYRPVMEKTVDELLAEPDAEALGEQAGNTLSAAALPGIAPFDETLRGRRTDGVCTLLGSATDYIAVLSCKNPVSGNALTPLWQKRFDFVKSVNVCGLNAASGVWEKVIAESPLSYSALKLALQLADRSGAVSELRLRDFHDLARDIAALLQAVAELPDVAAASARALELDGFCAEVDQMIGLNILPGGERKFSGGDVARVAAQHGMSLQADGAFHLADEHGHTVFSLGNYDNTPLQHHTLGQMWVNGLTLLLDVPRVEQPVQRFEEMAVLARQLAMDLRATVVDDLRAALGEPGIAQIRDQIAAIENRMLSGKVAPGSAQARRLFS